MATSTPRVSSESDVQPILDTKITFSRLSSLITHNVRIAARSGGIVGGELTRLLDALHLSPRLPQWTPTMDRGVLVSYQLWTAGDAFIISVSPTEIKIIKGIRHYPVASALHANSLYTAIETAQRLLKSPGDFTGLANATDDEFFRDSNENSARGMDVALIDVTEEEDSEVIAAVAEVSALETEGSERVEEDYVKCSYCHNYNKHAFKGTCPKCPKTSLKTEPVAPALSRTYVTNRLKSLQGRVLTLVEASFPDKVQREAVKTLINKEFRRDITKVSDDWELRDGSDEE